MAFPIEDTDLQHTIAVANLAAIRSRVWSYGWRVGHLVKALGPAQEAIDNRLRNDPNPCTDAEFRYFSRTYKRQLIDTTTAAITVLVHSFFDIAISELLATCIVCSPPRWQSHITREWKKSYSLDEVLALDRDAILERATAHYIKALGRKSIVTRHELLLSVIVPGDALLGEQLSKHIEMLKRVDQARHDIIHQNGLIGVRYQTAIDDAGHLLAYTEELILCTGRAVGVSAAEIYAQMAVLGLEGVHAPLQEEDLRSE